MKLQRRIALVTGGNSGVGRAIALRAAAEGARVAITGRNRVKGDRVPVDPFASKPLVGYY
jgi:NAD(P)-dependent dehydrogenase (short-subunit alcohol dehydrogenase family)